MVGRVRERRTATAGPARRERGPKITTSGSGESYIVNGSAKVVCGNVKTANTTVYIIDSVLMPSS